MLILGLTTSLDGENWLKVGCSWQEHGKSLDLEIICEIYC